MRLRPLHTAALQHLALSCHKLIKLRHFSDSYGNTGHGAETTAALGVTTMADLDSSSLLLASRRTSAKVRQVCCYSLFMEMLSQNNAALGYFMVALDFAPISHGSIDFAKNLFA